MKIAPSKRWGKKISRPKQQGRHPAGFSLIEVMCAMAVFAIGFMAVMSLQIKTFSTSNGSRQKTVALTLAKQEMEFLQGLPFYTSLFNFNSNLTAGQHSDSTKSTRYTIWWTVVDDDPLPKVTNTFINPPPASVTVSKTITIQVTPQGQTPTANNVLATTQLVKIWLKSTAG